MPLKYVHAPGPLKVVHAHEGDGPIHTLQGEHLKDTHAPAGCTRPGRVRMLQIVQVRFH